MSDQNTHEPFDDELLSAYLDELTPAERARVEERLAVDPAARQLLDQLRSVSRAVQELPKESLGEDLRAAILERAQAAKDEKVETDTVLPWPRPQLSAGRTKRAWMWAGLAVAAALLIMVFQPNAEDEEGIPGVVAMRGAPEEVDRERSLEARSGGEVSGPERESVSAPSGGFGGGGGGFEGGDLAARSAPPATVAGDATIAFDSGASPAASEPPTSTMDLSRRSELAEGLVLSAPADGRSASGEASAGRFVEEHDESRSESVAAVDEDLLVVHVQLTPVAFQNKTFDGLLIRNGIAVDDTPAVENRALGGARSMDRAGASRQHAEPSAAPSQVDVVLVDAPASQVIRCLDELDRDTTNYLAVDVEGQPSQANLLKDKAAQADQWKQYNRGIVSPQQKALLNSNVLNAPQKAGSNYFGFEVDRGRGQENLSEARQNIKNYAQQARAMRVPIDSQAAVSPAPQQISGLKTEMSAPPATPESAAFEAQSPGSAAQKLADAADNIQVLFLLCPEHEPASSPPADSRVP